MAAGAVGPEGEPAVEADGAVPLVVDRRDELGRRARRRDERGAGEGPRVLDQELEAVRLGRAERRVGTGSAAAQGESGEARGEGQEIAAADPAQTSSSGAPCACATRSSIRSRSNRPGSRS